MAFPARIRIAALLFSVFATGWAPAFAQPTGDAAKGTAHLKICHGFGCHFQSQLDLGAADARRLSAILAAGRASPPAERAAVSKAVQYYEKRAARAVGMRDQAKSNASQWRRRGQMDCIDESTNTRTFLLYLERRGLLKHHTVARNRTRGFLIDRRYPHSTAVLQENSGEKWTVDSWYAPAGGAPDIMKLSRWLTRGVMGVR
jgi:hypothetical protein